MDISADVSGNYLSHTIKTENNSKVTVYAKKVDLCNFGPFTFTSKKDYWKYMSNLKFEN